MNFSIDLLNREIERGLRDAERAKEHIEILESQLKSERNTVTSMDAYVADLQRAKETLEKSCDSIDLPTRLEGSD